MASPGRLLQPPTLQPSSLLLLRGSVPPSFLPSFLPGRYFKAGCCPASNPGGRRALPAAADLRSPPSLFLLPPPLTSPQGAALPSLARALSGPARPLSSPGDSTASWRGAILSGALGFFFFFSNICLVLFRLKCECYYILDPFSYSRHCL